MPSFDIIETSGKAYMKVWEDRRYFLRLAAIPFAAKMMFFGIVVALELQSNIIRQTLIMLPVYFLEGWMVVHVARYVFMSEKWPFQGGKDSSSSLSMITARSPSIFAAIILYVLIKMSLGAIAALVIVDEEVLREMSQQPDQSSMLVVFATFFLFGAFIWAFRLFFAYIPMALDIRVRDYLRQFSGFSSSFQFIGAWLICYVPFILGGLFFISMTSILFGSSQTAGTILFFAIHFAVDMIAMITVTVCFTMIIKQKFGGRPV